MRDSFIGTGVALATPFTKTKEIDVEALKKLVHFQIDNGIDYIVVLGTTAESATLTKAEKKLAKDTIITENAGRLPLVLGLGGNDTKQLVEDIQNEDLEGFDALLSVTPFYNKPTQNGLYKHFEAVSKASPLPIILYNVPGRTGVNMSPVTVTRLANDFKNIIGIKEAAGDLVQAMQMIKDTPENFLVISGDDMITLPMVLAGGSGVISVMAEGFPKSFSQMVKFGLERNVEKAFNLHYKLMDGIDLIFKEGNPAGIKAVFELKKIATSEVRLPLVEASKDLKSELSHFIEQMK
ncbi:4-hydroxy-tetrahydrodipicolinate synthase [Psychroflexus aestuariivivens]|uniref:4-hydroxy-tetrahydrodipicolinate synthase n=1 Tax=Psychroflexus aestuariivivens TaxID=1795040 RepID=UPI000FD79A1D|nr:4-hydroxy-tetrahydrodipicolinate synthase [Psychroflexus aestuariivivens]